MKQQKYQRELRRQKLLAILRNLLLLGICVGFFYMVKYIDQRSTQEVDAVKNRPESEDYMVVEDPSRMTVVNEDGEMSMEITADSVRLSSDQRSAVFSGAHAIFYEGGVESLVMDVPGRIEYDTETEDFLLAGGLTIDTRDGMNVQTEEVEWRRVKNPARSSGTKVPSFRFPKGVNVTSREGNNLSSDYMQADKELMYMELVGHVTGTVSEMSDTEFITERDLTDVGELNLEDFETLAVSAEQVIYDKRNQVILATSRFYDRAFEIRDMDGRIVRVEDYQPDPQQILFSKKEITVRANHLEAKIEQKWAECIGNIDMVIPPAEPEEGDDRALKAVKKFETKIATEDVEYFWGHDYILTHGPTRVEQEDRLAMADQIVYWGEEKQVLLDGDIAMVQGDGSWLVDEELVDVADHDMRRAVTAYSELYSDRAVIYLNNNDFVASGNVLMRQEEREVAADTIVYQDEIKRITADGNVKYWDKDDQQFVCNSMMFHNDSDYMEVWGGAAATLRIPAKYANDINRTLADMREEETPPEITDPEIEEGATTRNPNLGSQIATGLEPLDVPGPGESLGLPLPESRRGRSRELLLDISGVPGPQEPAGEGAVQDPEGEAAE